MKIIAVKYAIKPGCEELFRERILRHAATLLGTEAGCRRFDVSVDPSDPSQFFLYEVYDDEAALQRHLVSDHLKAIKIDIVPWAASREAHHYNRISAP